LLFLRNYRRFFGRLFYCKKRIAKGFKSGYGNFDALSILVQKN